MRHCANTGFLHCNRALGWRLKEASAHGVPGRFTTDLIEDSEPSLSVVKRFNTKPS